MTGADQLAREFDVDLDPGVVDGGRSGSQVHRATRSDGAPVIVKITLAESGVDRSAAERELAFYTQVRGRIGIRTPELLDHHRSADCVAIMLSAHDGIRPAERWTDDHWLALARDLAALHQAPLPDGALWRHGPDDGQVPGSDPGRWRDFWDRPGEPELFAPIFDDPDSLTAAVREQSPCLIHGDCHTDNILVTDAGLVWTDWQGTKIGHPAGELAFAAGRAVPSGASVPLPEMITTYAELRGLDPVALDRSVLAAGLSTVLFVWPPYLAYNTATGVDRVHANARRLARRWLAS